MNRSSYSFSYTVTLGICFGSGVTIGRMYLDTAGYLLLCGNQGRCNEEMGYWKLMLLYLG
jgi:hypothetical protein